MMQTADVRNGNDLAILGWLARATERRIAIETLMGSMFVVQPYDRMPISLRLSSIIAGIPGTG